MLDPKPFYTLADTKCAYQLNWSLSLFWHGAPPPGSSWLDELKLATEPDGVRILQHSHQEGDSATSQFLLSSRPEVSPSSIVRSVKGRLQYIIRASNPRAFRRNFSLRSTGGATREQLEEYIAGQVAHHPVADPRFAAELGALRVERPEIDLQLPAPSSYGLYWYNLHVVLVNDWRERETDAETLRATRDGVERIATARGLILKQASILPDHMHFLLRPPASVAPGEVAICFMNNLSFLLGNRARFKPGFFVGTVGEYRRSAIGGTG